LFFLVFFCFCCFFFVGGGGGAHQFKDSCSHGESLHRLFEREFEVIEHGAEVES